MPNRIKVVIPNEQGKKRTLRLGRKRTYTAILFATAFPVALGLVGYSYNQSQTQLSSTEVSLTDLQQEKALLVGFLADIGLFCLVNEYHLYLEKGNYLDSNLAMQIFHSRCPITSEQVLKTWGFDNDFIEVASNQPKSLERPEVSYLDIARIANHVLLYRKQDHEALEEHEVEINVDGAEVLYKLTTMSDQEFKAKTSEIIRSAGM